MTKIIKMLKASFSLKCKYTGKFRGTKVYMQKKKKSHTSVLSASNSVLKPASLSDLTKVSFSVIMSWRPMEHTTTSQRDKLFIWKDKPNLHGSFITRGIHKTSKIHDCNKEGLTLRQVSTVISTKRLQAHSSLSMMLSEMWWYLIGKGNKRLISVFNDYFPLAPIIAM